VRIISNSLMSPLRRRSEKIRHWAQPVTVIRYCNTAVRLKRRSMCSPRWLRVLREDSQQRRSLRPYAGLARPPENEQLDLRSLLDRQIGRLLALENPAGVNAGLTRRSNQSTVSTNKRLSSPWRPLSPSLPGISGSAPPAGK
jgi:hypothetical protein